MCTVQSCPLFAPLTHFTLQPSVLCFRRTFDLLQISHSSVAFQALVRQQLRVWPARAKLYSPPSSLLPSLPRAHFISDCPEKDPKTQAITETRPADECRSIQGLYLLSRVCAWRDQLEQASARLFRKCVGVSRSCSIICMVNVLKVLCSLGK